MPTGPQMEAAAQPAARGARGLGLAATGLCAGSPPAPQTSRDLAACGSSTALRPLPPPHALSSSQDPDGQEEEAEDEAEESGEDEKGTDEQPESYVDTEGEKEDRARAAGASGAGASGPDASSAEEDNKEEDEEDDAGADPAQMAAAGRHAKQGGASESSEESGDGVDEGEEGAEPASGELEGAGDGHAALLQQLLALQAAGQVGWRGGAVGFPCWRRVSLVAARGAAQGDAHCA